MSSNIAIITARGGSKRIIKKNIRSFHGKPIIAYSIEAAKEAGCFQEVMVSTDCEEIAEIARHYGANVPFLRSAENSNDKATSTAVLQEVIGEYAKRDQHFDLMCCIYPTAAFITAEKLRRGFTALTERPDVDAAFTVVRYSFPIQRAFHIEENLIKMLWPENRLKLSQELEPTYHDAGQFYWLRVEPFMKNLRIFAEHSAPIVLLETEVQDIDHEEDWKIAELKFDLWQKSRP